MEVMCPSAGELPLHRQICDLICPPRHRRMQVLAFDSAARHIKPKVAEDLAEDSGHDHPYDGSRGATFL